MTINKNHPNRGKHNWLLYDIGDAYLERFSNRIRGHVYDLGCGEMTLRSWILTNAEDYTGVDWSNSLHELKADLIADLNEHLPVGDSVADTVLCLSVMEHLREPQSFLSEAHRILRAGGTMLLQVPFMWRVHEAPHDYFRYTKYGLEYMFAKAGFCEVQVYPQTGFWVMWTLKLNYQTVRVIRGPSVIRTPVRLFMKLLWAVDQRIAPWLDRYWPCDLETAGYFVVAKKRES